MLKYKKLESVLLGLDGWYEKVLTDWLYTEFWKQVCEAASRVDIQPDNVRKSGYTYFFLISLSSKITQV